MRTVAIIAAVWLVLILLFCVLWAALMRAVNRREDHLGDEENAQRPTPNAEFQTNVIEWKFPNPKETEKPAA